MGDYIDLEFFQNYTRTLYDGTTTPTSTTVETYIDLSEQEINETTRRTWGVTVYTNELYDLPNQELLLKNYPVSSVSSIKLSDDTVLTEGIDEDYIIDGDFVLFNKNKYIPDRVYVTYTKYNEVRSAVKMLTTLLTLQKLIQSESSTTDNTESISIGPISLTTAIGTSQVVNLDYDINKYWKQLRRLIR